MAYKPVGPGYLVLNSGTLTTSGNWTVIKALSANYDTGLQTAWTTDAFTTARLASGVINMPAEPSLSCEIVDADLATLVEFFLGSSVTASPSNGGVLGLPDAVSFLASSAIPTIGFIPLREAADGEDAEHGIWFPKAYCENLSEIRYQRIEAGSDAMQTYTVNIRGLLDDAVIASGYRTGFIGVPSTAGATYTLPTLATDAV